MMTSYRPTYYLIFWGLILSGLFWLTESPSALDASGDDRVMTISANADTYMTISSPNINYGSAPTLLSRRLYSSGVKADEPARTLVADGVTIEISYQGAWPAAAQTALEHAAQIWEPLLSSVPAIHITAIWGTINNTTLASTFIPTFIQSNSLPVWYAYYPEAMANAIRGYATCSNCEEMQITSDSSLPDWYFGVDGNPPANQYDFVTVALRQIGVGLGFSHSFASYTSNGTPVGTWGTPDPKIYDLFIYNGNSQQLINTTLFPRPSAALYAQMISDNIFFVGPLTQAANGNSPARLHAPAAWSSNSFRYLAESTYPTGTTNALMTPSIQTGEVVHHPGPVALAMLYDMGWPQPNSTPTFSQFPNQFLQINTVRNNAIDLWAYVEDDQPDNELIFAITNSPASGAGISLDNNRFIDIYPTANWVGQTTVTIEVTDPFAASSTSSFTVIVADLPITSYLPLLGR